MRITIECEMEHRCAKFIDECQVTIHEGMATEAVRLFKVDDHLAKCRQADTPFHLTIATSSGIFQLEEAPVPLPDRQVALDQTVTLTMEIPGHMHLEVHKGLKSRDPVFMRRHLEHSRNLLLSLLN